MMKGQLSFEFMFYVVFSILAITGALVVYTQKTTQLDSMMQRSYLEGFVSVINSNIGYSKSEFTVFVPKVICKSLVDGSAMHFDGLIFNFNSNIKMDQEICSNSGGMEKLVLLNLYNGTYELGV